MATVGIGSNPLNPLARTKTPPKQERVVEESPAPSQQEVKLEAPKIKAQPIIPSSSDTSAKLSLDELLEALGEHGYVAKARPKYVKHTFDIKEGTYKRFSEMCPALGRKVKEAVTEAFDDWCNKYQKQYETIKEAKEDL